MTTPRARATIVDVAEAADVSVATVSRALRGLPNVAPSTRDKVVDIARSLDYRPDPSASRLAAGRSKTVAMAVPALNSWYFSQVMASAEAVLTEAGYDLLTFSVARSEPDRPVTGGAALRRSDGLILVDLTLTDDEADDLDANGIEVVTLGTKTRRFSSVGIDDVSVAETAVQHLVDLGHTRIALLAGLTDDPLHFEVPRERRQGYQNVLLRSGIEICDELERAGNFSVIGGYEATEALLDLGDPPTAIFAMSDEMAFGAMQSAWGRGLSVPDDLSIVGVDNHDFSPVVGLTTIDQAVQDHGTLAATVLLHRFADSGAPDEHRRVLTELVERTTTGPPRTAPTSP